jgi:hypothetical protein
LVKLLAGFVTGSELEVPVFDAVFVERKYRFDPATLLPPDPGV